MKKEELKQILKPLIKECIKEVIFEDGTLSTIIKEVVEGTGRMSLKENKTDIKILEKQLRANIGWRQLIAQKFRSQIIIQEMNAGYC